MHLPRIRPALPSRKFLFLPLLLASLLLSSLACGQTEERRVLVYAAASLRDVLTELGQQYETANDIHVAFNWGGSVALANQLKRHAPGDVFVSAGAAPMDDLQEAGLVDPASRITIASNSLVVVVSKESEATTNSVEHTLLDSDLIGMADPALSPAGRYAQETLESMGLWHELHDRMVLGSNVRTALAYVESDAVDTGLVYRTDAINNEGVRIAHEIPPESHSPIIYPVATLKDSRHQTEASLFLKFLSEESAQARFRHYGFITGE